MAFFSKLLTIILFLFCSSFSTPSFSAEADISRRIEEASARFRRGVRNVADVYFLAMHSDAQEEARYYLADALLKGADPYSINNEALPQDVRGNVAKVIALVLCKTGGDESEKYFRMLEDREAGIEGYRNARQRLMAILSTEAQADEDEREDDEYRRSALEAFFEGLVAAAE